MQIGYELCGGALNHTLDTIIAFLNVNKGTWIMRCVTGRRAML